MPFDGGAGALSGILAGAIMAVVLYMGIAVMPRQMKMNLFLLLGTMILDKGPLAYVMGGMVHAGMSVGFALAHVAIFDALDVNSALVAWGLLFGLVHWAIVGMALGMMPIMHRGIRLGVVEAPGAYALRFPPMTAMGFLMLHLLYGLLVGAFYEAFT